MNLIARFRHPNVWIPSIFFAIFAVVISVNAVMVYVGAVTWRGVETRSSYASGQVYNERLAQEAQVRALGWTLDATVEDLGAQRAAVAVRFTDGEGYHLTADILRVAFVRPTQEGFDVIKDLSRNGSGVYEGAVELPLPGLWELRIAARRGDDEARASKRLTVEP